MTKAEAMAIANAVIDELVTLAEFERREDIELRVLVCDDDNEDRDDVWGRVVHQSSHGLHELTLYVTQSTTSKDVISAVLHEMSHIFTAEFRYFYDVFVCEERGIVDPDSISWSIFEQFNERIAKRLATLLTKLYNWDKLKRGKNG